ncbi:type I-C CRISPR-associated protein Cas8c/Csd1 [Enterovirga aerilata]|uniref:Type I-C CRISPR-associated protein Cas8c/Csd1 n=1 Tax=Enterovirga aerilata TaxID=2730920 RepID=A0A849HW14_9HYPH|nr:type I-C CRISPR-associated protein Cas8c/Csd1 [Enterovirga sp. DB1703]NNM71292.1 type I-C CRISPR-associated protein Cas8c/Csd1 [Enterovirga sp. DB1703]
MTILASLARAYERLPDKSPPGYSSQPIGYVISLNPDGTPAHLPIPRQQGSARKPAALPMSVPQPVKRTSGIAPNLLWDKTSYALGVTAAGGRRTAEEHAAFRKLHAEKLAGNDDAGLTALRLFLERWTPGQFEALGWPKEMIDQNVAFVLESDRLRHLFIHDRPAARALVARVSSEGGARPEAVCLVTGERAPVARLHPSIKGVWGAQTAGASIVSFNLDAFTSYGHEQGDNAPVSEAAAFAYTTALNRFLARDSRNRIQIGDASTVFWADASAADAGSGGDLAAELEGMFRTLLGEGMSAEEARGMAEMVLGDFSRVDEVGEAEKLRAALRQIRAGRPGEIRLGLAEHVRFHVLGLAPNAARLSVRFWLDDEFGVIVRRYAEHVDRMRIEPKPRDESPSIWRCLVETATLRKTENIPPNLAGDWLRAILAGTPYPLTLLTTLLMRMRADKDVNALRAAMLKAVLMRNFGMTEKEAPVGLDPDNDQPGYLLGRLFATYERIQTDALPGLNATIRDKFYGAASATPRKVFTLLDRGSANHLAKIAKDSKGRAVNLEKLLSSIMERLRPDRDPFPAFLSTDQQALFPLGYYHQKSEFFRRKETGTAPSPVEETAA